MNGLIAVATVVGAAVTAVTVAWAPDPARVAEGEWELTHDPDEGS